MCCRLALMACAYTIAAYCGPTTILLLMGGQERAVPGSSRHRATGAVGLGFASGSEGGNRGQSSTIQIGPASSRQDTGRLANGCGEQVPSLEEVDHVDPLIPRGSPKCVCRVVCCAAQVVAGNRPS